jgi:hypothetical protein
LFELMSSNTNNGKGSAHRPRLIPALGGALLY